MLNNTRVFPARLIGRRLRVTPRGATILGGRVEVFLVSRIEPLVWEALVRPGRALLPGARVEFARGKLTAEVLKWREAAAVWFASKPRATLTRSSTASVARRCRPTSSATKKTASTPSDIRPCSRANAAQSRRRPPGLHFTPELLDRMRARGIEIAEITLHVGYGTFQPVRVERVEDHQSNLKVIRSATRRPLNQPRARRRPPSDRSRHDYNSRA